MYACYMNFHCTPYKSVKHGSMDSSKWLQILSVLQKTPCPHNLKRSHV